jgi:hypothetical protein
MAIFVKQLANHCQKRHAPNAQYREFGSVADTLDFLVSARREDRLPEVGGRLIGENDELHLILYPTTGGRYAGSGPWIKLKITPDELPMFLDQLLPGLGIRLCQQDFRKEFYGHVIYLQQIGMSYNTAFQSCSYSREALQAISKHFTFLPPERDLGPIDSRSDTEPVIEPEEGDQDG